MENICGAPGLHALVEMRTQVKAQRFRIPDVLALWERPKTAILRTPPHIVVEILSPEDTVGRLAEKIEDYLDFGVPNIWVVDPPRRAISRWTREGSHVFTDAAVTADGSIAISLDEIFSQLPEIEEE